MQIKFGWFIFKVLRHKMWLDTVRGIRPKNRFSATDRSIINADNISDDIRWLDSRIFSRKIGFVLLRY
jgi:hypothetical protein